MASPVFEWTTRGLKQSRSTHLSTSPSSLGSKGHQTDQRLYYSRPQEWVLANSHGQRCQKLHYFQHPDGGHFNFKVMPFELNKAPSTFQRLMLQSVIAGSDRDTCIACLDDIIVFSNHWTSHQHHVERALEQVKIHGLTYHLDKCCIGKPELKYFGHTITGDRNLPQEYNVQAITNATTLKTRKEVRGFIGICNWEMR